MSTVEFTKMSGAGNDFVVLAAVEFARMGDRAEEWVRRVCRRGLSVGADGVLSVERVGEGRVAVEFRNPDGSRAFCANGSRCAARFAWHRKMAGTRMLLETAAGAVPAEVVGAQVTLELPAPQDHGERTVDADEESLIGRFVSVGVPHFVTWDENLATDSLERWGPVARRDSCFGDQGCNVNLAHRVARGEIHVRTWERGVEAETLSCGSGAVAVAFASWLQFGESRTVVVPKSGVSLDVSFRGCSSSPQGAVLTGDARIVFEGRLDPEGVSGFRLS